MLAFAGLHGVKPVIEKFPMSKDDAAGALEKLKMEGVRYRGVLCAQEV